MKPILFSVLFLLSFASILSQEKQDSLQVKTNRIIYAELNLSYMKGNYKGLSSGFNFNYQYKKNLFTFRFIQNYEIERAEDFLFGLFPTDLITNTLSEYSLLYGRRFIENDFSYHFSLGISYNDFTRDDNNDFKTVVYAGFPIEIGVNWFNAKKEQFKIWDLIPVGVSSGFGRSIGLKFYANLNKKSYYGLGLVFGLGYHKQY